MRHAQPAADGMVLIFALPGYLNIRLHQQQHLEQNALWVAERISDVIKRGTTE